MRIEYNNNFEITRDEKENYSRWRIRKNVFYFEFKMQ